MSKPSRLSQGSLKQIILEKLDKELPNYKQLNQEHVSIKT